MKSLSLLATACLLLLAIPFEARTNSSGAPAGRTGSPAEGGNTCNAAGCHIGNAVNSGSGSISVSGPKSYAGGQAVRMEVTVEQEGSQRIGFQISAVLAGTGTHAGSWNIVDSNTKFASNNAAYVTHTDADFGESSRTFTVEWMAPANPVGTVTFYVAGNAANGNGSQTGDFIYTTQVPLPASGVSVEPEVLPSHFAVRGAFPNPAAASATVTVALPAPSAVSIRVIDLLGREVARRSFATMDAGEHDLSVGLGHLPPGTYLVSATAGPGRVGTELLTISR